MISIATKNRVDKDISLPGSKSITNRTLIIGALARGESAFTNWLDCDDTGVMIGCLRSLGFKVRSSPETLTVTGGGGEIPATAARLFTGNSGTSMRFLTGLVSLGKGKYTLDGVPRMRERPIGDLLSALKDLGVTARSRRGNGCPPVDVQARGIRGGDCELSGEISSQFLSSLLLSAPYADSTVKLRIKGSLVSRPYVTMTLKMIRDFGGNIEEVNPRLFSIPPRQTYSGRSYLIEGDASSASYFWAAAAITGGRIKITNIGRNSIQGDSAFPDILEKMGAKVNRGENFLEVRGPLKRGIKVDLNKMPDMVPTLAICAVFVPGRTVIANVENLRFKECDRLKAMHAELQKIGATVEELNDGLVIQGGELHGAEIDTYDDHRIAMAFALAGLQIPGIRIKNPECVAKTFPGFFDLFLSL